MFPPFKGGLRGILIFSTKWINDLSPITLAGTTNGVEKILFTLLKALTVIVLVLFAARWAIPYILHEIVKTKLRELFVITIILLCIGTAFLTSKLGLSLALGAFLAGIVISESEYAYQAISDILPFKESFIGLFFISVGMLLNINFLFSNFLTIITIVLAILFLKTFTTTVSSLFSGEQLRPSIQTGFYLSQIGEFSFVLAVSGKNAGLLTDRVYQIFIASSIITMF